MIVIQNTSIEMNEVFRTSSYVYWEGIEQPSGKTVYNITPVGSYKPNGGYYSKEWIMGRKNIRIDYFDPAVRSKIQVN